MTKTKKKYKEKRVPKNTRSSNASELVWDHEKVPVHGFSKPDLILSGRDDRWLLSTPTKESRFLDPTLKLLIPCKCPDEVHYANDKFLIIFVNTDEKRVVHDVEFG